jgi:hypothetical protein
MSLVHEQEGVDEHMHKLEAWGLPEKTWYRFGN